EPRVPLQDFARLQSCGAIRGTIGRARGGAEETADPHLCRAFPPRVESRAAHAVSHGRNLAAHSHGDVTRDGNRDFWSATSLVLPRSNHLLGAQRISYPLVFPRHLVCFRRVGREASRCGAIELGAICEQATRFRGLIILPATLAHLSAFAQDGQV